MKIIWKISCLLIIFSGLSGSLFSQDYWTKLNGPYGGNVIEMKRHPDGTLFGIRSNALFKSTNEGSSWTKVEIPMVNNNLCMDISSSGIIYVGKSSGGIWWSANSGQSWNFNSINVSPHSGLWASVILAKINPAGHVVINNYISFNGGTTFTSFVLGSPSSLAREYAFNGSNHIYAATSNGIFYSVNNATSWTNINGNLPSVNTVSLMFDNNILITGLNGNGVFKTSDNGMTWTAINNGITSNDISRIYKDAQGNYYAGTYSGKLFKSANNGELWTELYESFSGNVINSIHSDGSTLYVCASVTGVMKSTNNGKSWSDMNYNLHQTGINSLALTESNEIFAASYSGIYYSSDNGNSWTDRRSSLPSLSVNSIYRDESGYLFCGIKDHGIYKSADNGISWFPSNNGLTTAGTFKYIQSSSGGFVFAVRIPAVQSDTLEIYRTQDDGVNWTRILRSFALGFNEFAIDASGNLYVTGLGSNFLSALKRSTDNGNTWSEVKQNEFTFMENLTSSGTNLYMNSGIHIYKSVDFGSTWMQLNNGSWQSSAFNAIAVNNSGILFASVYGQVYATSNDGLTWIVKNSGISPLVSINNFYFNESGFLYGTSHFDGIFKSVNSTLTSLSSVELHLPEEILLEQNYPNPFNPDTKIKFSIPEIVSKNKNQHAVILKVYNSAGKEINELINKNLSAGIYEILFDATGLSSGIYFYSLFADGKLAETKRMILLK